MAQKKAPDKSGASISFKDYFLGRSFFGVSAVMFSFFLTVSMMLSESL
jgi:hypothetical protein